MWVLFNKMKGTLFSILGVSVHLFNINTFYVKVCVCMLHEGKEKGRVELHSLAPWRTRVTIADIAYTPSGDMLAIVSDGNLCRYVIPSLPPVYEVAGRLHRVPTHTGKPGKMGRNFPVREKWGNFE